MRAALLQCDEVDEKFRPQFGSYVEMIRQMFLQIDAAFQLDSYDCPAGNYPHSLDEYDFFVTTGSRASVYDRNGWIEPLIAFVRRLNREKRKFLGICFGHQLAAVALQSRVEKSSRGWGVGVATNQVMVHTDWMDNKRDHINILTSHQDQVVSLPQGALVVAASDFCPYFMVQWNDHFLSIQGHPEWRRAYGRALMNDRRSRIAPATIEAGLNSLEKATDNELITRWFVNFTGR